MSSRHRYTFDLPICCLFVSALLYALMGSTQQRKQVVPAALANRDVRVLFLGNSLTAANDLPAMVQAMAAKGWIRLTYKAFVQGGFNLEDHWNDGQSLPALRGEKWDYVVLQQGPSTLPASQADLKKWSKIWADEARKVGAKPALYMVWPFQNQADGFQLVSKSYRAAAKESKSGIFAAGVAWEQSIYLKLGIRLYLPDRLHPTPAGSYLAALIITHGLTDLRIREAPTKLTLASGHTYNLSEADAKLLRIAAEVATK